MTKVIELLDSVKEAKSVKSDYALAKSLDLPTQRISDYYKGKRMPDEFACLQIAKALNRSYEDVSAIIQIESEKDEKRRNAWREYYKSIGGVAASVMLWVFASVTFIITTTPEALANTANYSYSIVNNTNYATFGASLTQSL